MRFSSDSRRTKTGSMVGVVPNVVGGEMYKKPFEFDEAICQAIGRGVCEIVKVGDEISVFSLLEAIESFIERRALSESEVAAADDALDLITGLVRRQC
ncbi:hypothetical protein [Serratia marcescens]|nr:hypothetical protein [Serratia marcescens]